MESVQYESFVNHQMTTDCFQVLQAAAATFLPHQLVMTTTPFGLLGIQFSSIFLRICPCHTSVQSTSLTVPENTARAQWEWGKHSQFHHAASSKVLYLEQWRPKHDPSWLRGMLCSEEGCMYSSLWLWHSLASHSTDQTCGVGEVKYSKC